MHVSYGSANDIVAEYDAAVQYVENQPNPMNMKVYVQVVAS